MKLINEIRACTLCAADLPLVPRPILQGSAKSRILIAGQAPGKVAHEKGIPFDDASGNRFREWLGVDKQAFYDADLFAIVPMGFCFPGTGKSGDHAPLSRCAETWRSNLLKQLRGVQLTLVIGQYAQDWHLNRRGSVTEIVQGWRDAPQGYMPLPHPSPRNNRWLKSNPWFEKELLPQLRTRVKDLLSLA